MDNKLDMKSKDLAGANIEVIAQFFPSCITEQDGKKVIDFEKLKLEFNDNIADDKKEKYELTWPGKRDAIIETKTPTTKTLVPLREKSVDFDNTKNVYIEGDNLEVLKVLQESYLNKIKCIYIDPPYNTGNDFIYKDDFKKDAKQELAESGQIDEIGNKFIQNTETNGRYHSDWLNMMYPRIKLARNLLKEDGVIFISIDDNEYDNLKKVCDEIFGETNFIANFTVEINPKGRKNSKFVSVSAEYCIVYAKNINSSKFVENIPKKSKDMSLDANGVYVHNSGKRVVVGENNFNAPVNSIQSKKNFSVYYKESTNEMFLKKEISRDDLDTKKISKGFKRYVSYRGQTLIENTYSEEKFIELFEKNKLQFSDMKIYEKNTSDTIRIKSVLKNENYEGIVNGKKQNVEISVLTTAAKSELKSIFETPDELFPTPKNRIFIEILLTLFSDSEMYVLDFFSGSATTAHASMSVNSKFRREIKYILVQLPEKITEKKSKTAFEFCLENELKTEIPSLAQERIKRAAKKIKEETNAEIDYGFRVFKLSDSTLNDNYYAPKDMLQGQIDLLENKFKDGVTQYDILTHIILDLGLTLDVNIKDLSNNNFIVEEDLLYVSLCDTFSDDIFNEIKDISPDKLVLSETSFEKDSDLTNVIERFKNELPNTTVSVI